MAGRGGLGRGRGRGRGLLDGSPVDGAGDVPQPPKLYPDRDDLPSDKTLSREEEELLDVWKRLEMSWQASAYRLEAEPGNGDGTCGGAPAATAVAAPPSALSQLLTLHPALFPEELYSRADRTQSAASSAPGAAAALFGAARSEASAGALLDRLDALGRMEGAGAAQDGGGARDADSAPSGGRPTPNRPGGPGAGPRGDADADADDDAGRAAADDDEDGYEDEDDYLQGEVYDDDEEYDADDGDGDGEATY